MYGELFLGIWPEYAGVVFRRRSRLADDTADECQFRRSATYPYTGGDAGKGLFRKKFTAVFTIPVGYLLGGALVDRVFEPFMSLQGPDSVFTALFGTGKGSGASNAVRHTGSRGCVNLPVFQEKSSYKGTGEDVSLMKTYRTCILQAVR